MDLSTLSDISRCALNFYRQVDLDYLMLLRHLQAAHDFTHDLARRAMDDYVGIGVMVGGISGDDHQFGPALPNSPLAPSGPNIPGSLPQ